MGKRLIALSVCFLLTAAYLQARWQPEDVPLRAAFATFPIEIDRWVGRDLARFSPEIEAVLGADDYLTRSYSAAGEPAVSLYLGYHKSQRQGDSIHSPMNCLPGAGWQPVETERTRLQLPGRAEPVEVNQFVIQKGLDRQLVLYWYQSHGRVIASEYWSKAFLVYDSVRRNRSDAALVRVITPIAPVEGGRAAAIARATAFARAMFPHLESYLPS
jgi:EpsI family protein